ncbi:DNA-binding protein, partial [Leptospira selangorensis]
MISRLKKRGFVVQTGFDGRRRFLSLGSALDESTKLTEETTVHSQTSVMVFSLPALDETTTPLQKNSKINTKDLYTGMLNKFPEATRKAVERVLFEGEVPPTLYSSRDPNSLSHIVPSV